MTITDQISERVRLETVENTTFSFVKNLWEAGQKADYIASVFELSLQM